MVFALFFVFSIILTVLGLLVLWKINTERGEVIFCLTWFLYTEFIFCVLLAGILYIVE